MKTYISKPVEIKAELFNPDRIEEYNKMGAKIEIVPTAFGKRYILPTLEGNVYISEDSYLVCGIKGEFYPCRKDIFEEKYFEKPTKYIEIWKDAEGNIINESLISDNAELAKGFKPNVEYLDYEAEVEGLGRVSVYHKVI